MGEDVYVIEEDEMNYEVNEVVEINFGTEWRLGVIKEIKGTTIWLRIDGYVGLLPREINEIRKYIPTKNK
jgi:hypothetical protein